MIVLYAVYVGDGSCDGKVRRLLLMKDNNVYWLFKVVDIKDWIVIGIEAWGLRTKK